MRISAARLPPACLSIYSITTLTAQVEEAVRTNALFADTFLKCWKFGKAKEEDKAKRFDRLQTECRKVGPQT